MSINYHSTGLTDWLIGDQDSQLDTATDSTAPGIGTGWLTDGAGTVAFAPAVAESSGGAPPGQGGGEIFAPGQSTTHLTIDVTYDSSFASLTAATAAGYKSAIAAAVQFYENEITNPVTVDITFGYGEADGETVGGAGESLTYLYGFSYAQMYAALSAADTTTATQRAAIASLPSLDPTGGATFGISTAEMKALGIITSGEVTTDGYVGIGAGLTYGWSQAEIGGGSYDAVGILEHEISEVMGRFATIGKGGYYTPLDMFHYKAANGSGSDSIGAAAGALDEPFVAGYNPAADAYFSYDGSTVTLPFDTPSQVAAGDDVADWNNVPGDSYDGTSYPGGAETVSATDLQVMNVIGYDLACFASGTRILTARGEVAVEHLKAGDPIITLGPAGRSTLPLRWLGRSKIAWRGMDPVQVLPIRIREGALGHGLPLRDLLLSPTHAVLLDGLLVHAAALVNGSSIVRQPAMPEHFTYWHIELDTHAIVLAEGVAAESYLDTHEPLGFDNWHERRAPPEAQELAYPRCKAARQVPAQLRARIAALAVRSKLRAA